MSVRLRGGLTLIELLVVIAIIGLLIGLLMAAIQAAREAARRTSCLNNMRQIGVALQGYANSNRMFPPSNTSQVDKGGWIGNPLSENIHSWRSQILPYLEQGTLYNRINFSVSVLHPDNLSAASQLVPVYRCPSYLGPIYSKYSGYTRFSNTLAIANYIALGASDTGHLASEGSLKPDGVIYPRSKIKPADIRDGLSNTLLVAETKEEQLIAWIDGGTSSYPATRYEDSNFPSCDGPEPPLNFQPYYSGSPFSQYGPSSNHPGGVVHGLADGSSRLIRLQLSAAVYKAIVTRAGRETMDDLQE
jgi:prepilin-type N-terminal cleavage/methylation domain-containing protein